MSPPSLVAVPEPDLAPFVDELRAVTDTDFAAAGLYTGGPLMTLTALSGAKSDSLRALEVRPDHGLGGKVLTLDRPMWVADYAAAKGITHHYDAKVRTEGLRAMVAVPFRVPVGIRGVMYASMRRPMAMGDRMLDRVVSVARRLEAEAAVAAEVSRRIAELMPPARNRGADSARDQCLRDVHAELTLLRDCVGDGDRPRIDTLLGQICSAMGTAQRGAGDQPAEHLTPRELDVLIQVATGATNVQAAERLRLAPATTKSYLQNAARKLGAHNRVEAVANARRAGLLP